MNQRDKEIIVTLDCIESFFLNRENIKEYKGKT